MKFSRQTALASSLPARKLSGKPPRSTVSRFGLASFQNVQGTEFDIGNPAGQGLARLPEQFDRSRSQKKEPAGPAVAAATAVDKAPERLEQFGRTLDFVEDHQFVFMGCQIVGRIGEPCAIRWRLKVEINGFGAGQRPGSDGFRQRCLAGLARTEQGDGGELPEPIQHRTEYSTLNHSCNYGVMCQKYKDE